MRDNYKEPKLTYALDTSGKMVHIGSVERGLSCNCRCPKCNELLVAKLGHEGGRQSHFAHQKGSDCHGSYMTALHKLAEQIIEEKKAVMAPAYKNNIEKQKLYFEHVEVEQRVERKDLQPDIVGITSNGLRWFIEIRNTHEINEAKRAKLVESNITCLEIDVREQTLENLKSFLLESAEKRVWINNPIYEKRVEDAYREKVSIIIKHFEETPELQIQQGTNIPLHDLRISVSEDGLYAGIKAVSLNGIPYLFHIGNHEVLERIKPTKECNELLIDTDNYIVNNGFVSVSNMKRLYLYIPKKETEPKIKTSKIIPEDRHISRNDQNVDHKNTIRVTNYIEPLQINSKRKETIPQRSFDNPLHESLPFDRFWTIEEYYEQLLSSNSYETKKGQLADIIKCERINNGILLLYKDPNEVRPCTPFHIAIIYVRNGNLIRNEVAVFTNKKTALNSYYSRLKAMRESPYVKHNIGNEDSELPF